METYSQTVTTRYARFSVSELPEELLEIAHEDFRNDEAEWQFQRESWTETLVTQFADALGVESYPNRYRIEISWGTNPYEVSVTNLDRIDYMPGEFPGVACEYAVSLTIKPHEYVDSGILVESFDYGDEIPEATLDAMAERIHDIIAELQETLVAEDAYVSTREYFMETAEANPWHYVIEIDDDGEFIAETLTLA